MNRLRLELARLLLIRADDIDDVPGSPVGLVRQVARILVADDQEIAELKAQLAVPDPHFCPCGRPIVQPERGRPRRFCSDACRRRANRRPDEIRPIGMMGFTE